MKRGDQVKVFGFRAKDGSAYMSVGDRVGRRCRCRGAVEMPDRCSASGWNRVGWDGGVRESLWLFPAIETVHLLGMTGKAGGYRQRFRFTAVGLGDAGEEGFGTGGAVAAVGVVGICGAGDYGVILFASEAVKVYANPAFQVKILLILLAGVHALIFHWGVEKDVAAWDGSGFTLRRLDCGGYSDSVVDWDRCGWTAIGFVSFMAWRRKKL